MREQCTVIFWTWVCMVGGVINPFAVAGALIGTCFFLASPKATTLGQKIYLGLFSCGMGFGGGIFFYPGGPPWSEKAMIVSGAYRHGLHCSRVHGRQQGWAAEVGYRHSRLCPFHQATEQQRWTLRAFFCGSVS
jgi:hypothetical protein